MDARWVRSVVAVLGGGLVMGLSPGCAMAPEQVLGHLDGPALEETDRPAPPRRSRYEALMAMGLSETDLAAARELWPDLFLQNEVSPAYRGPDLWARVRAGFKLPAAQRPEVQAQAAWFTRNPGFLDGAATRAQPYLFYIVEQVEGRGIPSEIALLPVIESAFQPFALSPAEAAGLWQFIPSTGRRFGLRQDPRYDARRDVYASTDAALDYLETLHRQFDGDWLLALAAYNWGEGNVARAVERNRRRGRPTDFWSLSVPDETRTYVPRLLGLARVVSRPAEHGVDLAAIPNRPYITRVALNRPVDLLFASKATGLSLSALRHLNPGYTGLLAGTDGERHIVLPVDKADLFLARMGSG